MSTVECDATTEAEDQIYTPWCLCVQSHGSLNGGVQLFGLALFKYGLSGSAAQFPPNGLT